MSTDQTAVRTTLTPGRRGLFEQIATVSAGNAAGDVFAALCDNLWQAAAMLTDTPEQAERLILDTVPDMVRDMRENWPLVVEAKASCQPQGSRA